MNTTFRVTFLILIASQTIFCQSIEQIIEKNILAIGGIEAIHSIKTRQIEIKITTADGGEFIVVNTYKRPGLFHQIQTLPDGTVITKFINPTNGFITDMMSGNLIEMPQDVYLATKAYDADIDGPLTEYKTKGHSAELIGTETIDNSEAYKIKLTLNGGAVMTFFIDKQSYLVTRITRTVSAMSGDLEVISTLGDYRKTNGVMVAHEQTIMQGSMGEIIAKVSKIFQNIEIKDSIFENPKN